MMVTDLLQFLFHFILIGFPASLRQVWRPGEQVFQKIKVCVVFVFRYLGQEILYIFIDFQRSSDQESFLPRHGMPDSHL